MSLPENIAEWPPELRNKLRGFAHTLMMHIGGIGLPRAERYAAEFIREEYKSKSPHSIDAQELKDGTGYSLTPVTFCAALIGFGLLLWCIFHRTPESVTYDCFSSQPVCYGVTKAEGSNHYEFENILTGERREMRFCNPPIIELYAGYVLKDITITHGRCEFVDTAFKPYHIMRGKHAEWWNSPLSTFTHNDGADRPVLANNCQNTPDDKKTVCDGGRAKFRKDD